MLGCTPQTSKLLLPDAGPDINLPASSSTVSRPRPNDETGDGSRQERCFQRNRKRSVEDLLDVSGNYHAEEARSKKKPLPAEDEYKLSSHWDTTLMLMEPCSDSSLLEPASSSPAPAGLSSALTGPSSVSAGLLTAPAGPTLVKASNSSAPTSPSAPAGLSLAPADPSSVPAGPSSATTGPSLVPVDSSSAIVGLSSTPVVPSLLYNSSLEGSLSTFNLAPVGSASNNLNSDIFETLMECYNTVGRLEQKVDELKEANKITSSKFNILKIKHKSLKAKFIKERNSNRTEFRTKITKLLKPFFSATQINWFIDKKKIRKWTDDDIAAALTLKSVSPRAYKFIKCSWKLPLPGVSTLDSWVKDINVEPGLLNISLRVMKIKGQGMTSGEKACVLSFDEMKLHESYSYDKGADRIYGPRKYVQVVVARSIIGKWRQPVYYEFDQKVTKELLLSIISSIEDAGFPVHACVSDMGGSNVGLHTSLGINVDSPAFTNPADESRQVHVLADPPHLLKLVRNNLLDHGITNTTMTMAATSESLYELVAHEPGDFKIAYKIGLNNLDVRKSDRQKVCTAAHLLSETVGKALHYLGFHGHIKSVDWKSTADFILLVDKWFDLLNSSSFEDKPSRSPFRANQNQREILEQMISFMSNARVCNKVYPFIRGLIITSKSLLSLFHDVNKLYDIKYIFTRRLNQDILEHLFGMIRQMGSVHDHPNCLSFKYRIKKYILGKNHSLTSRGVNTSFNAENISCDVNIKVYSSISSPIKKPREVPDQVDERCLSGTICSIIGSSAEVDDVESEETESFVIPESESDGFKYVLGYTARKFRKKHNFLVRTEGDSTCDWIDFISRGGLMEISPEYIPKFEQLEGMFRCYHGEKLVEGVEGVNRLVNIAVGKGITLPVDVIEFFFRLRVYFKIRLLNRQLSASKFTVNADKNNPKNKKLLKITR